MDPITFTNAYYIKLGRRGSWESESIASAILRFGWGGQTVDDMNAGRWDLIRDQLRAEHSGKPGVATTDLSALRNIVRSGPEDVWITFHMAKLWWTRLTGPVDADSVSKFRRAAMPWTHQTTKGRLLVLNDLPGKLTQLQSFRGTVCRVGCPGVLQRVLNGTRSPLAVAIESQVSSLSSYLTQAIQELNPKDFEILVDLVFRAAGWVRVSVLGQHAKAYDLELREPITGDRYVVQVKSQAGIRELEETAASFSPEDFRRIFFVVHSPKPDLTGAKNIPDHIELVPPKKLGELAIHAGLTGWLKDKVS